MFRSSTLTRIQNVNTILSVIWQPDRLIGKRHNWPPGSILYCHTNAKPQENVHLTSVYTSRQIKYDGYTLCYHLIINQASAIMKD